MSTPELGQGQNPENPPAERPESDQVLNTEQPEAKHPKLGDPQPKELGDDTGMGSQSSSKQRRCKANWDLRYCLICCKGTDHSTPECPNKSKGYGILCFVCLGPCKSSTDEHKGRQMECIKFCEICGSQAKHWTDFCPYEDDKYFGTRTPSDDDDDGFF